MVIENYSNVKILDCTLRDGGYVNNFSFGRENISKIINGLSLSKADIIELGFLKNGNHSTDQSLFSTVSEAEAYITNESEKQKFCLMIRPDWYDISKLEKCTGKIKFIRFAFHYEDLELMLYQTEIAKKLGYEVFFNPVNVLSYTDTELEKLIIKLNNYNPVGIYIVDTFGSLLPKDLKKIFSIFDNNLDKDISLGLHLHENLSISLALAINFIEMLDTSRKAYIDSSILGMGRVPGNLCTETIMNYLNSTNKNKFYNVEEIYKLIDSIISKIKNSNNWGYMPEYAISAFFRIHRSYPEYFMNCNLSLYDINKILQTISMSGLGEEFDEFYAEELYKKYKSTND